jgi:hypothetical protein
VAAVARVAGTGTTKNLIITGNSGSDTNGAVLVGYGSDYGDTTKLGLLVSDGVIPEPLRLSSSLAYSDGVTQFVAVTVDEVAGNVSFYLDGNSDHRTNTFYNGPTANTSTIPYRICDGPWLAGSRFHMIALWSRALTSTEIANLRAMVKQRFTSLA